MIKKIKKIINKIIIIKKDKENNNENKLKKISRVDSVWLGIIDIKVSQYFTKA